MMLYIFRAKSLTNLWHCAVSVNCYSFITILLQGECDELLSEGEARVCRQLGEGENHVGGFLVTRHV